MRVAWQVATDAGFIGRDECDRLVELQLNTINHMLKVGACAPDARETLMEMKAEYAHHVRSLRSENHEPLGS